VRGARRPPPPPPASPPPPPPPSPAAPAPSGARAPPLSSLKRGQTATVHASTLTSVDQAYLQALGLRLNSRVRLCRVGEPCIVSVASAGSDCGCGSTCRIGLAKALAQHIYVTIDQDAPAPPQA